MESSVILVLFIALSVSREYNVSMSKNHSGRPLNVNHHMGKQVPLGKQMQPRRVASRMEGAPRNEQRKPGKGK